MVDVRKVFFVLALALLLPCRAPNVAQAYDEKVYKEQLENSGAEELFEGLPNEVKGSLEGIGVDAIDFSKIMDVKPEAVLESILGAAKKKLPGPLKAISMILAVILLNAIFTALKVSLGERPLAAVLDVVSALCVCMIIVAPVVEFIARAATIIRGATTFLLGYIPVMVGIMVASGQALSSAAFGSMMVALGDAIAQLSAKFLVPMLNVFLTVSVVCAISPRFKFAGLCELFSKIVKWVLGFAMTIFSGILTTKSLLGSAVDSVNSKAMKFALGNFVPVVGGALGDAFLTVQGCVKILKSGVGAFFIIAMGFIFLPVVVECIVWTFAVNFCAVAGDIFELSNVSTLLKNIGKVVSTLMAVILCIMTVLIISTVVVLNLGGGGA